MNPTSSQQEKIDRLAPSRRPREKAVGYQNWHDLSFLHWRISPELLQTLIPEVLTIDTWNGEAYIGIVPFYMTGVRPWWSPAVPGLSNFAETNVRTYVHLNGQKPGVWFFSLEAARSLPVRLARWLWHLSYYRSRMNYQRVGDRVNYRSERLWPGTQGAMSNIEITVGERLAPSQPGTLEHFLAERYFLYTGDAQKNLYRAQVHHTPYPLRSATVEHLEESLLAASGIERPPDIFHAMFSEGVEVDIFKLQRVVSADTAPA